MRVPSFHIHRFCYVEGGTMLLLGEIMIFPSSTAILKGKTGRSPGHFTLAILILQLEAPL